MIHLRTKPHNPPRRCGLALAGCTSSRTNVQSWYTREGLYQWCCEGARIAVCCLSGRKISELICLQADVHVNRMMNAVCCAEANDAAAPRINITAHASHAAERICSTYARALARGSMQTEGFAASIYLLTVVCQALLFTASCGHPDHVTLHAYPITHADMLSESCFTFSNVKTVTPHS